VGKFAPLHRGHERLLLHAQEQCEELWIVSYSLPEFPGCEPERRAAWLAELFPSARAIVVTDEWLHAHLPGETVPHNDADEDLHRRFVARLCLEWFGGSVEAVFTSEDYGDGFAAVLTECFRARDPLSPAVIHCQLDRERVVIPISGTAVRHDVHARRRWLSPAVYASFVERICLLGGESSGKSTLCAALAARYGTAQVEEYGRERWESQGGVLTYPDMLKIGREQAKREEAAARRATRYLFCDTSPLTTLFYSREMFGEAERELEQLAERRYSLVVLCDPDIPFIQDGTRRDEGFRHRQYLWYLEQMERRRQPWILARGALEQRLLAVDRALSAVAR
jgi:NadR type nicotinamide-nucleotide adenylyltransferase